LSLTILIFRNRVSPVGTKKTNPYVPSVEMYSSRWNEPIFAAVVTKWSIE